jgi:hypothetical protein
MGDAARKLEMDDIEARRALLRALPLTAEPPSEEEHAAFEQMARELAAGVRGLPREAAIDVIERMPRDQGE